MLNAREIVLKKKILSLPDLPTLSANVMELLQMLNNDSAQMSEIINKIKKDPVLVTKMLRMVNSSLYSLPRKIENVDQVAVLLGMQNIKQLIMSSSVMDVLSHRDKALWDRAYNIADFSRQLIKRKNFVVGANFAITALVKDIGQVVLKIFNADSMKMVAHQVETQGIPPHVSEQSILGVDHAVVGGWLLESWDLDQDIVVPVFYSHNSEEISEDYVKEIALLQVLDFIDCEVADEPCYPLSGGLLEAAGIGDWMMDELAAEYREFLTTTVV